MDSGWAGAVATIVTALIIAGTAVAAFMQLRHGRNANDIVVYLRLVDFMDSPTAGAARRAMRRIPELLGDAEYRERLRDRTYTPPEMEDVGALLRFLEHISVLITKGGVAESLVLAEYADTFVDMWETLRPAIVIRRHAFGPHTGRAFEHLAMRAKRYIDSGTMDSDYAVLERDTRELPAFPA
ncbi:MAG: hypothetical protein WCE44_00975 [Candidatus Velthaea sp.]|jgi:flagellar motor component MotA